MKASIFKRLVSLLLSVAAIFTLCSVTSVFAQTEKDEIGGKQLQFKNGKFKILVLSDIQDTNKPAKETTKLVNSAIDKTNPDFIVLLGDNIAGWWKKVTPEEVKQAIDAVAKPIDSRGIPFALVYGNHDHEGLCDETNKMEEEEAKSLMMSWFRNYKTCMAIDGEEMTGVGNYNITIKNTAGDKDIFNLWFMDSNPYTPDEEGGGYGYVHEDQTAWYKKTSDSLKKANNGKPVPSIVFQHIIVPEAYEMFKEASKFEKGAVRGHGIKSDKYYLPDPDYIYEGKLNEGPCSPDSNHGQFESWLEQGDVVAGVFGHDHSNSFAGVYKDIRLVAVPGTTFYSYGNNHGVRTITLHEDNLWNFDSEILTYEQVTGTKITNAFVRSHGYYEYYHRFLPLVIGGIVLGAALIGITIGIVNAQKKKKRK